MHLFVYGTLKRGELRNAFLARQTFLATACTRPLYRLFDLGEYPGLIESTPGLSIEGELWQVDEACLLRLDRLEGCDVGLYRRELVQLASPHEELSAVTYFYQKSIDGLPDCGARWRPRETARQNRPPGASA
jgi:gamma-glutamylaminecyclotransferase